MESSNVYSTVLDSLRVALTKELCNSGRVTPSDIPDHRHVRRVLSQILTSLSQLDDGVWDAPAQGLDWSCRETAAHLVDGLARYALQLAGESPPQSGYVGFRTPPPWQKNSPPIVLWPDPRSGTAGIISCLDATGGLLCAVVKTAPPGRRGWHPYGVSDASGFAAMGIVEASAHTDDICGAHGIGFRADDQAVSRAMNRLFPTATDTGNSWQDLLTAMGRTPDTRDQPWSWDSSVRRSYGDRRRL